MQERTWCLISSQGAVLFYIAVHPGCTTEDIAEGLGLTQRAVWGNIRNLREAGMLRIHVGKRRQRYTVNLDAPFLHPTMKGFTLRPFLTGLVTERLLGPAAGEGVPAGNVDRIPALAGAGNCR